MKRWEAILQTIIFSAGVFLLLLMLAIAVHQPLGRLAFGMLVSGLCLIAELFALFKVMQWLWRLSARLAGTISHKFHPPSPPASLTEVKN